MYSMNRIGTEIVPKQLLTGKDGTLLWGSAVTSRAASSLPIRKEYRLSAEFAEGHTFDGFAKARRWKLAWNAITDCEQNCSHLFSERQ
jgi:hypothetical protein